MSEPAMHPHRLPMCMLLQYAFMKLDAVPSGH